VTFLGLPLLWWFAFLWSCVMCAVIIWANAKNERKRKGNLAQRTPPVSRNANIERQQRDSMFR
jgi:hypothetical protein